MRFVVSIAALFAAACSSMLASATPAPQTPQLEAQLVEANGYTFNVVVTKGDPALATIVLEAGGGADSRQFAALQPQLARETGATVISYDRPGFGLSPLPDKPYDIVAEVDAIRQAIDAMGLGKQEILVGSSYGGFLIQIWASRAPQSTKGLLFLDPNSPAAVLPIRGFVPDPPPQNPTTPRQIAQARVDKAGDARFAAAYLNPIPVDVPVIVLSAGNPLFPDKERGEVMRLSHELLAASVRNGKREVVEGSGHNIPGDKPGAVIAAVKELIATKR